MASTIANRLQRAGFKLEQMGGGTRQWVRYTGAYQTFIYAVEDGLPPRRWTAPAIVATKRQDQSTDLVEVTHPTLISALASVED
jgi:hypothetical protein